MGRLGYSVQKSGKTGGSRRKYYNEVTKDLIFLDVPHDGEMKPGMVRRLQADLGTKGLI